jgi:putative transcriptional regulator
MITIKIADIAKTKGLKNAYTLQKALNISPTMASRLWKGTFKQIGVETIDKLCKLLDCEPSDLIVYISDKPKAEKPVREPQAVRAVRTDGMLTTQQVADELRLSPRTIRDYIESGRLKATTGKQNHKFISQSDFEEFCKNRI